MPTIQENHWWNITNLGRTPTRADLVAARIDTGDADWGVRLDRQGMDTFNVVPAADTDTARYNALKAVLIEANSTPAVKAVITLLSGKFVIPAGSPMNVWTPDTAADIQVVCRPGACHYYNEPDDATHDVRFFRGDRYAVDFGLEVFPTYNGSPIGPDQWGPLQAVANSLESYYPGDPIPSGDPIYLESGRISRFGKIILPPCKIYTSRTWFVSPTVWVEGTCSLTNLILLDGSYDDPLDPNEHYLLDFEFPTNAFLNNLFGTRLTGVILSSSKVTNRAASGLRIGGGQHTYIDQVSVHHFGRTGVYADGLTIGTAWISDNGRNGIIWLTGGTVEGQLSVEHNNGPGTTDPQTGEAYAQIKLYGGGYSIAFVGCEESPTGTGGPYDQTGPFIGIHAKDVGFLSINVFSFATYSDQAPPTRAQTALRISGLSKLVSAEAIFSPRVAKLIHDDSTGAPINPYEYTGPAGQTGFAQYDQTSGHLPAGRTVNNAWTGDYNVFDKNVQVGTLQAGVLQVGSPSTDGGSLTVVSQNYGTISLVQGTYTTTRTTSYFNNGFPVPHDWNSGKMTLTATGTLNLAEAYQIAGVQVVGPRKAAVAAAVAAAAAPTVSEFNALVAVVNSLRDRLRVTGGHGLIAD